MEFKFLLIIYPLIFLIFGILWGIILLKNRKLIFLTLTALLCSIILIGLTFSFQLDALLYSILYTFISLVGAALGTFLEKLVFSNNKN